MMSYNTPEIPLVSASIYFIVTFFFFFLMDLVSYDVNGTQQSDNKMEERCKFFFFLGNFLLLT